VTSRFLATLRNRQSRFNGIDGRMFKREFDNIVRDKQSELEGRGSSSCNERELISFVARLNLTTLVLGRARESLSLFLSLTRGNAPGRAACVHVEDNRLTVHLTAFWRTVGRPIIGASHCARLADIPLPLSLRCTGSVALMTGSRSGALVDGIGDVPYRSSSTLFSTAFRDRNRRRRFFARLFLVNDLRNVRAFVRSFENIDARV